MFRLFSTFLFLHLIVYSMMPSLNGQELYKLTTYRPYFSTTTDRNSRTKITCAMRCSTLKCPYFTYQDGVCQIHNPGAVSTNDLAAIYRYFDPTAPVEMTVNVAYQKPCYASSHHASLDANRAVDDSMSTQFHSGEKVDPWWIVDLEEMYIIRLIDIYPHPGVASWFREVKVYVGTTLASNGDFSTYTEVGDYPGIWDGASRILYTPPSGTIARYVAIKGFSGTQFLNILEVKVMA